MFSNKSYATSFENVLGAIKEVAEIWHFATRKYDEQTYNRIKGIANGEELDRVVRGFEIKIADDCTRLDHLIRSFFVVDRNGKNYLCIEIDLLDYFDAMDWIELSYETTFTMQEIKDRYYKTQCIYHQDRSMVKRANKVKFMEMFRSQW